jgi:hypothetical protein
MIIYPVISCKPKSSKNLQRSSIAGHVSARNRTRVQSMLLFHIKRQDPATGLLGPFISILRGLRERSVAICGPGIKEAFTKEDDDEDDPDNLRGNNGFIQLTPRDPPDKAHTTPHRGVEEGGSGWDILLPTTC